MSTAGVQESKGSRIISRVVAQHAEDAAVLYGIRARLVCGGSVTLRKLNRADSRLAASLDGLRVAGEEGWLFCAAPLDPAAPGAIFTATVRAVEDERSDRIEALLALVETISSARHGLHSAFGWLEPSELRGIVVDLLNSPSPLRRETGVVACAMHRVDPGLTSARRLEDTDALVRARSWRTAGELGRRELVSTAATAAEKEQDPACRFWSAWSAVVLGDRHGALQVLEEVAGESGPFRRRAFQLALQVMSPAESRLLLQPLLQDAASIRQLIRGAGLTGDPAYVPWLINHMTNDPFTRLAGESFSLMTGIDLAWLDLERKPPENFETGPNDDPNDPNVDMDEDDGLPWPDQEKVQSWWNANSHRFQPGMRYFMGEPLNRENCLRVLKGGFQRQRIAAAYYLSLLNPGTPLFEWRAPAWRQQRLLAQMT